MSQTDRQTDAWMDGWIDRQNKVPNHPVIVCVRHQIRQMYDSENVAKIPD